MLGKLCFWIRWRAWSDKVSAGGVEGVLPKAVLLSKPAAKGPATRGAAARGAAALRNFRLEISCIIESPSAPHAKLVCGTPFLASLRNQHGVSSRLDVPDGHHGVVFMDHVVAVDRVLMQPIAETEEQLHPLIGM